MMPSLFIAHGAPTIIIENHAYTEFLDSLRQQIPRPSAIVVFSAHWEQPLLTVGAAPVFETIYDFGGFPEEMYQMTYPARSDAATIQNVTEQLQRAGIAYQIDAQRGLDHGVWSILKRIYPEADVPVIPISVHRHQSNAQQYAIGKALAALKQENVLIIGSGGTTHNLRAINWRAHEVEPWAAAFEDWIQSKLERWDTDALFDYESQAPHARHAVPTSEHFIPLLLAMGCGDVTRQASLLHRSFQYGTLGLTCWRFE